MPDYLSSGFEFVLTLTCFFCIPFLKGYPSRTTFVYCNVFKDLVLLSAFVKRKWCKDNAFLFFLPNFQKFFFIFSSYRSPLPKSVAKIRLFINLFQIFYRVFYAVKHNFYTHAGCQRVRNYRLKRIVRTDPALSIRNKYIPDLSNGIKRSGASDFFTVSNLPERS